MAEAALDIPALWTCGLWIPWLLGILLLLLPRGLDRFAGPTAIAGVFLAAAALSGSWVLEPGKHALEVVLRQAWIEELGLEFVIVRDGLAVMFALLIAWVSVLVTVYAWRYLPHANRHEGSDRPQAVFYALISFFTAAMLGVAAAGNVLQLYFFWEATTISSYLLIGYWHHQPEARHGARLSLGLTVTGSVAMLVGFFWLAVQTGHWNLDRLLAGGRWSAEPWLEGCAALILTGALAKSAQAPFSSWLPAAMHAPTPVSAFLHSSALLAAGLYLLARFYSLLHVTQAWSWMLMLSGAFGCVMAGLLAVRQKKMKPLLAYSTIAQFAFMFMAFGLGTPSAVKAALYAFFLHTFVKAGLFMTAGTVTHVTGRKSFSEIGGLIGSNRMLALFGLVLGLSLTGFPGLAAFYYEEEYFRAARHAGAWGLYAFFFSGGVLSFVYVFRFLYEIFLRPAPQAQPARAMPFSMGLAVAGPAALLLISAAFPDWMGPRILDPAIAAALGASEPLKFKFHFDAVFATSLAAAAAGILLWGLFLYTRSLQGLWQRLPDLYALGSTRAARAYSRLSEAFLGLHNGDLGRYLRVFFVSTLVLAAIVWSLTGWNFQPPRRPVDLPLAVVLAALVVTSGATVLVRQPFTFILVLTLSGFAMAAAFVLMSAPNIALAQVLVEILIDLSIILALKESLRVDPERTAFLQDPRGPITFLRVALSLGIGAVAACGTYWAVQDYPEHAVGQWYVTEGFARTGKQDMVAVILTDFRALDTLVEVLVFTAGMFALFGLFWKEKIEGE